MTCNCANKEAGNGNGNNSCGDGQIFDKDAGKCVPKETKAKEQVGDPKTQSTQADLPSGDPGDQPSDVSGEPCGAGERWDATQQMCVPSDRKDPGDGQTQGTDKTASVENKQILTQLAQIQKHLAGANESKKPLAKVTDVSGSKGIMEYKSLNEIAPEMLEAISEGRNYVLHVPLDYMRSVHVGPAKAGYGVQECYRGVPISIQEAYAKPNKLIKEAVAITNTHATQDLDTDVAIVPGGISFIPVFQFAKVKQVQQGFDRARFFTTSLPANGSQTVGSTPSEATQTITAWEVTPSTITGVYLVGDYDEIENSPFDLLQSIVEASAASYDDFVATDMLDTVSQESALTPGLWINAQTGATITSSDVASVEFDETGILWGREYLANQGYLRGGIRPVAVLHPRQFRELLESTNVTSLATRSVPDIYLKATLEELFGVQIVESNAVENQTAQTNNAYNALMFVPKHSYGIAVKRDVTIKFHDIGEDNQIRVNTTWRTKSGVLDATSIVRMTSTAP